MTGEEFETATEPPRAGDAVRQQSFEVDGPVELDLGTGAGRIEVRLVDEPGVHVEVRPDPDSASPWLQGVSSLLNWLSDQASEGSPAEAVRQARIDLSAGRLVVRTPKALPLRTVPVALIVRAPAGSHVTAHSGSSTISVTGAAGRLNLNTSSGEINAERAAGMAAIRSGSGTVRLGPMLAGLRARTGTGDVEVTSVGGPSTLHTSSGDVWLGAVAGDVMVRTGSGNLTVADALSGQIDLHTGTGGIRVGVRAGTPAEIDLSSSAGEAHSELPLSATRPATEPALHIRGRTAAGAAVVSPAAT